MLKHGCLSIINVMSHTMYHSQKYFYLCYFFANNTYVLCEIMNAVPLLVMAHIYVTYEKYVVVLPLLWHSFNRTLIVSLHSSIEFRNILAGIFPVQIHTYVSLFVLILMQLVHMLYFAQFKLEWGSCYQLCAAKAKVIFC